jgi:hypothetical protein
VHAAYVGPGPATEDIVDSMIASGIASVGIEVLKGVIPVVAAAALAFVAEPVRTALLYRRIEYDFEYESGQGTTSWDIQWEDFRLTIDVEGVHNDYIEVVTFKKNHESPGDAAKPMKPSSEFRELFHKQIYVKLTQIVRTTTRQSELDKRAASYILHFVLRRRK